MTKARVCFEFGLEDVQTWHWKDGTHSRKPWKDAEEWLRVPSAVTLGLALQNLRYDVYLILAIFSARFVFRVVVYELSNFLRVRLIKVFS